MGSAAEGVRIILDVLTETKKEEKILIVTDDTSRKVADIMWGEMKDYPNKILMMMPDRSMHGEDPPQRIRAAMEDSDVIFNVARFSMFHAQARYAACAKGARFANMPDFSPQMLEQGALYADFAAQEALLDKFADKFVGKEVRVTSKNGTDVTARFEGRTASHQIARCIKPGSASAPPNLESAIGPLEGTGDGVIVVDGSIPHPVLGVVSEPIRVSLKDGKITGIEGGKEAEKLRELLASLNDDVAYRLAEIGFGFNNAAKLCNRMLEDEGCMGTGHFGFGSNTSFGGNQISNSHLDMVYYAPTLTVDGKVLIRDGEFILD